jgi:hypothetical protein
MEFSKITMPKYPNNLLGSIAFLIGFLALFFIKDKDVAFAIFFIAMFFAPVNKRHN